MIAASQNSLLGACTVLNEQSAIPISLTPSHSDCAEFVVRPGSATQLEVTDSNDLAIYLFTGGQSTLQDAFEFGRETLTITKPGAYRAELRIVRSEERHLTPKLTRRTLTIADAALWQSLEEGAARAKRTGNRAEILSSLGRWEAAADAPGIARTQLALGGFETHAGEMVAAQDDFLAALESCRRLADLRCVAEAANDAGFTERQLGNFDRSRDLFTEATGGWKHLGSAENEGITDSNLGLLYWMTGDYQQAIAVYDKARLLLLGRNALVYGRALNNLGLCYQSLADYPKAQLYFTRALQTETGLKNADEDRLRARLNLGRTLMLQGNLAAAQRAMEETLHQAAGRLDPALRGYALNNLGQVLSRQKQYAAAQERLEEALGIHLAARDRRWQATAYYWLGKTAASSGDPGDARDKLLHSLAIRREIGLRDDTVDSLEALGQLAWETGDIENAVSYTDEALRVLESLRGRVPGVALRASFLARRRALFALRVTMAMRPNNPRASIDGFLAAEEGRGRALLDLIAERPGTRLIAPELIARRKSILNELDLLSARGPAAEKQTGVAAGRVEQLVAADEEIEARIQEEIVRKEPTVRTVTRLEDIQESIPADSAILEFQLGEPASYLWLISSGETHLFTLPGVSALGRQLERALRLFPQVEQRLSDPAQQAAFRSSMAWLSRELLGQIPTDALPRKIILIPDGPLQRLPFAALVLPSGRYLGIDHDLIQAPSAGYLRYGHPVKATSHFALAVLAFVDPVFTESDPRLPPGVQPKVNPGFDFARLPFSGEIDSLARLVPASRLRVLRGFDANRDALLALSARQPGILHLSTHAVIEDQTPELSRIVLSGFSMRGQPTNGSVLPHDVIGLHLEGSIVVVSACRTALGKEVFGEGLMGFATSFFSTGAAQLVLTLTDVDAQASSVFMSETYRHYFAPGGAGMERAMTLARRSLLASRQWSDPFYWASFTVIGTPSSQAPGEQL